ncbi:hypothetical protein Tco_1011432 [Tanacetum coccineum]
MKRPTKGYLGQEVALFPTMLDVTEPSTSPSRITSSPSNSPEPSPSHSPEHSPQHSPEHTTASPTPPSPTQPSPTQPTQPSPGAEHHFPTPHDSPLHVVHSHGSDEGSLKLNELTNLVTKLSDRIGSLKSRLANKEKARIIHSDDEDIEDDSSKQGRKLSDAEVQEKASTETEPFIQEVTPTEVIQAQEAVRKDVMKLVLLVQEMLLLVEEVPIVVLLESEPKKKSKKELEQERLSFAEAIRLEEQMNKEQRAQIARDEEIAKQRDEEERQRAMDEAKSTKGI